MQALNPISAPLGLAIAFGAILLSVIIDGGDPAAYAQASAAILIFGGLIGVSFVAFPIDIVLKFPIYCLKTITTKHRETSEVIEMFVAMADTKRRNGVLALEETAQAVDEPFLRQGLFMLIDNSAGTALTERIRRTLETDIRMVERRHELGHHLLGALGGFAPTLGIIGTVMGLVMVISHMSDPSELGSGIATAFTATLYGVASANLLFLPLQNRLKILSEEETFTHEVMLEGVLGLCENNTPREMRERLNAFIASRRRQKDDLDEKA